MARTAWLRQSVRRISARHRAVGVMVALALAVPTTVPAAAQAQDLAGAPAVQQTRPVKGVTTLTPRKLTVKDQTKRAFRPAKAHWPAAATGTAKLAIPQTGAKQGAKASASGTPVWARALDPAKGSYQGPNSVTVRVLPQQDASKLGVAVVVLAVQPSTGGQGGGSRWRRDDDAGGDRHRLDGIRGGRRLRCDRAGAVRLVDGRKLVGCFHLQLPHCPSPVVGFAQAVRGPGIRLGLGGRTDVLHPGSGFLGGRRLGHARFLH
ncbi:hypothetical protein [Streptomyces sp. NPDC058335]|uniref:hypothetical protein n=1 Tax=Streptomyces sp. NPDC058335 TaxID=3346451 RepID=UPI0036626C41